MIIELPAEVRQRIAAGEVIERPVNVVKELIENSIDAKADVISIELEQGGLGLIRVRDNGIGMSKEDLEMCYLPHTTSKICSLNDLTRISSFGFRGEALASMARVARLNICSRTESSEVGNYVTIEKAVPKAKGSIAMPKGTEVELRDLFYNMPVRKKAIEKNLENEMTAVYRLVDTYAVSFPEIKFVLISKNKVIREYLKASSRIERIRDVFGLSISENLVNVEIKEEKYSLDAYLSRPGFSMRSSYCQQIYVNTRPVRSSEIDKKIKSLYKEVQFLDTQPAYLLIINVPPEDIDVNVHPNKMTVKFRDIEGILSLVERAYERMKEASSEDISLRVMPKLSRARGTSYVEKQMPLDLTVLKDSVEPEVKTKKSLLSQQGWRYLGQVNKTYLVYELPQGIMLIDQHAAEERVNYEQLLAKGKEKRIVELVRPIVIKVTQNEKAFIESKHEALREVGFEIDLMGGDTCILRTLPYGIEYYDGLLTDLVTGLKDVKEDLFEATVKEKIAMKACKISIKANQQVTDTYAKELWLKLQECRNPNTCPHGRPVSILLTWGEIEKLFKRKL